MVVAIFATLCNWGVVIASGTGRLATHGLGRTGRAWARMQPTQQLVLGFAAYALLGTLLLSLPFARTGPVSVIDDLFNVVSAISTTGLSTISVRDSYTFFGEFVILMLCQAGGIGFMTLSSVLILARGRPLSDMRISVLRTGFSLPHYFNIQHFLVQVVVFTFAAELVGTLILWARFSALGIEDALWQAVFHAVSAFATAGFSLWNNSLEDFKHDWVVNLTIGTLCYLGAIGFIVVQDVWYSAKLRERMLTFTSKVILWMTLAIFILGTLTLYFVEPTVRTLPWHERLLACMFQIMTASSTAGFNSISISAMSVPGLSVIMIAMLIGASPSGTGGGIKTTSVSAILGNLFSVLRSRPSITWLGCQIPMPRILLAFASTSLYLILLLVGVLLLTITESKPFLPIVFEAASAIGTVGLSMGITADLSTSGKLVIIALMFAGRCGPLTIGLALLAPREAESSAQSPRADDLAV